MLVSTDQLVDERIRDCSSAPVWNENSVARLTEDLLAELGLTTGGALVAAKENLVRFADVSAVVQRALDEGSVKVVKTGDTYDAARLLLVPGWLCEGEEVAAAISDRDTLILAPSPANGDWSGCRKKARTPAGDPLWPQPLRVTAEGIRPA